MDEVVLSGRNIPLVKDVGKTHISTIFKKDIGMSITNYHLLIRVNQAVKLLKNTSMNISGISETVGFSDPLYFSRVFKRFIGQSPSAYLKGIYLEQR